ncbi:MAG: FMN-binding protein [Gammaproteobacteria bacterium]|nr:FMN-binding protein [Gammaproteobacteria bacterium]
MTSQNEDQIPPETSPLSMIAILGGVAMLSGFLVVLVFQLTKPYIEENQRRATEKAIFKVVPGAAAQSKFAVTQNTVILHEKGSEGTIVYAGYDANGKLLGIAATAGAQGYTDVITLLYGYNHQCACIRGIQILKTAETPGLGDKIMFDPEFQKNFVSLDASLNSAGDALDNPIVTVKHGTKKNEWEIDAISGATISSRAVGVAINRSAQDLLPKLRPHLDIFRNGYKPPAEKSD